MTRMILVMTGLIWTDAAESEWVVVVLPLLGGTGAVGEAEVEERGGGVLLLGLGEVELGGVPPCPALLLVGSGLGAAGSVRADLDGSDLEDGHSVSVGGCDDATLLDGFELGEPSEVGDDVLSSTAVDYEVVAARVAVRSGRALAVVVALGCRCLSLVGRGATEDVHGHGEAAVAAWERGEEVDDLGL
ncbi:unnamed protein product, partial [Tilletia laevis]